MKDKLLLAVTVISLVLVVSLVLVSWTIRPGTEGEVILNLGFFQRQLIAVSLTMMLLIPWLSLIVWDSRRYLAELEE